MPNARIPGFIKKKTAAERYKRSFRQLTRDISLALAIRDEMWLPNLKIRTEDGMIIEGEELTRDRLKELKNEGQNPMWYLKSSWLDDNFKLRENSEQVADESNNEIEQTRDPSNTVPRPNEKTDDEGDNDNGVIQLLKLSNQELRNDKILLSEQLRIKDKQIEAANVLALESNEREKEYTRLLKEITDRLPRLDTNSNPIREEHPILDIDIQDNKPKQQPEVAKKKKQHGSSSKNTRRTSANAKQKAGSLRNKKKLSAKSKWYELPTLNRMLARKK